MNTNDQDPMHELLCAYILGEASEEQIQEIETALADSAELRAQRVELEQTIGLVKQGLGDSLSLSDEAMSSLLAAAAPGPGASTPSLRPWHAGPALRAAAGIVIALGGVLGVLALRGQSTPEGITLTALREPPTPAAWSKESGATEARRSELSGLGYSSTAADSQLAPGSVEVSGELAEGGGGRGPVRAVRGAPSSAAPGNRARATSGAVLPAPGSKLNVNTLSLERRREYGALADSVLPAEAGNLESLDRSEDGVMEQRTEESAELELDESRYLIGGTTDFARESDQRFVAQMKSMGYAGDVEDNFLEGAPGFSEKELAELADSYSQRIYLECKRRPGESPQDMFFRFWGDNSFVTTQQDRLSTFAADVDTASYALARRYLEERRLPTKAQIRTEEFVNYARPDLPAPTEGVLAIHTELAPSLFGDKEGRLMLRVGIRGQEVSASERKPLSLTFAIDVSGSMEEGQRLELVKHAIRLLVGQLHEGDKVGLVAYSREARMVLPMTDASERGLIESALHPLSPNGGTNAEAGLKMAYELALTGLDPSAHSRVILLSDGVANMGTTDQDRINQDVTRHREAGIYLNTIGVGMNNHNDVFLEQLANKGDGICDYVDDEAAARRAIVERFTGALVPIAGDVKIQVEFDPTQVRSYRLLGYENRAVADADFRNDAVDAGEIGAGHQVVALYELDMVVGESADILKVGDGPLATVRVRWKAPKAARQHPLEVEVTEISATVDMEGAQQSFAETSAGYRRSILTAQLAEFLRRSSHARGDSFRVLDDQTTRLAREEGDEDSRELANLVKRTMALGLPLQLLDRSGVDLALDEYQRYLHMRAQLDDLERSQGRGRDREIKDLELRNEELEERLRERIYSDLEEKNG
ncbi:MAG: von Willebrand factor type A domain-containing protein [Planctomycetota bacterium]|nr:von Willebrand factor type A domain-containing protein [Planctomycetota bacterium]